MFPFAAVLNGQLTIIIFSFVRYNIQLTNVKVFEGIIFNFALNFYIEINIYIHIYGRVCRKQILIRKWDSYKIQASFYGSRSRLDSIVLDYRIDASNSEFTIVNKVHIFVTIEQYEKLHNPKVVVQRHFQRGKSKKDIFDTISR